MQEILIFICLGAAAAYIVYTFAQKVRHKGGGCCGCGKDCCSSKTDVCTSQVISLPTEISTKKH